MAGYLGYALQAGVQGFQSGFNMAQKKSEMEWQKKKKKELEEKELKIKEGAALYSSLVSQVFADNVASEDEMMKLNTAFLAAGYEVQAVIKDTHTAIQSMDKNKIEQDLAWLDLFADMTEGLDPEDTQGTFDMIKGNVKSEKGLSLFDAYGSLQEKKYKVAQKEKELETTKLLPEEYRYPHLKEIGAVGEITPTETTKPPTMADEKSAITLLKTFVNATPEQFNAQRTRIEQRTGLDLSVYTQEILRETGTEMFNLYNTPEEVMANVKAPANLMVVPSRDSKTGKYYASFQKKTTPGGTTTPPAFKTLEAIKDSFKNVKSKAEYDSALQSYNASKEAKAAGWTPPPFENQLTSLIKKVESALWSDYVNKKGKLKSKNEADEYNARLQHYLRLIEEAKSVGLDVSQFQAFIPYKSLYGGIGDPLVTSEGW